ncbi:28S rRNA (cytosine-C(5))-methyltransferase-like [Tubulanus polymorphus]|uniref:28S rRNA (cytosine-C(5))-methyltransferase-like n=1 Tax=Tubulanus polymorphus TaxID=672921 RepID=UPI003DA5FDC5
MNLYRECERVIVAVNEKKGSIKSISLQTKLKNKKQVFALVCETLKYSSVIDEIVTATRLTTREKILTKSPTLTKVLLYDFLFGRGFGKNFQNSYKDAINRHKTALCAELARLKVKAGVSKNEDLLPDSQNSDFIPRYVRVNTLKTTATRVIDQFKQEGFKYVTSMRTETDEYNEFINCVKNLKSKEFMCDIHISNLLIFTSGTDLHDHVLYKQGDIILQDKASCMPAEILAPPVGSHVIDCCAAPGNKTTHAAAIMNNTGKVFAFDMDRQRLATMNDLCSKAGARCVETTNVDFLKVDLTTEKYSEVEYVIVDPSCSGSGIVSRMNSVTDDEQSASKDRILRLAKFQISILHHVFTLPRLKSVCYSTCSVHEEENENVVSEILKSYGSEFELCPVLPTWVHRGFDSFDGGSCCVRASPEHDLTNGFFVALFVRKTNENGSKNFSDKNKTLNVQVSDENRLHENDETVKGKGRKNKQTAAERNVVRSWKQPKLENEEHSFHNKPVFKGSIKKKNKSKKKRIHKPIV